MVSGIQSTYNLTSSTWTVLSTGPASANLAQLVTISVNNRSGSTNSFQLAVNPTGTASPSATDYLEYNTSILNNGVYERRGITLYNGQQVMIYANTSNFTAVAYAPEDYASSLSGIFSRNDLTASTWTTAVTTPAAGRIKVCRVSFCNRSGISNTIYLAVTTTPASPANADYIDYNYTVNGNTTYERTGIVISAGYYLAVFATNSSVSCVAHGIEDSA